MEKYFPEWVAEAELTLEQASERQSDYVELMADFLRAQGITTGKIIDAGAGLGRNTIYCAKKGYSVTAVENDSTIAAALKARIGEGRGNIDVQQQPIEDVVASVPGGSLDGYIDYGTSSYIPVAQRRAYGASIEQKLKPGAIVILHFPDIPATRDDNAYPGYLDTLFDLHDLEILFSRIESNHNRTVKADRVWTIALRKTDGAIATSEVLQKMVALRVEESKQRFMMALSQLWVFLGMKDVGQTSTVQEVLACINTFPGVDEKEKQKSEMQEYFQIVAEVYSSNPLSRFDFIAQSLEQIDIESRVQRGIQRLQS